MGTCVSIINSRVRQHFPQEVEAAPAPVPDSGSLELEDLLRLGIAEAQVATVARKKRERLRHLHTARGLLTAALRRCGQRDPDLCAHLLAVLLKLGEDARTVQGLLAECGSAPGGAAAHAGAAAGAGERASPQSPKAATDASSEHSSDHGGEPASIRLWEYDELKEGFLHDSADDDESPADPLALAAAALSAELGAEPGSPTGLGADGLDASGKSRAASLSPVKEGDLESVEGPEELSPETDGTMSRGSSAFAPAEERAETPQAVPLVARGPLEGILGRLGRSRASGSSDSKEPPGQALSSRSRGNSDGKDSSGQGQNCRSRGNSDGKDSSGQAQGSQDVFEERCETPTEPRGPLENILGRLSRARSSTLAASHEPPAEAPSARNTPVPAGPREILQPSAGDPGTELGPTGSASCPQSPLCPSAACSPPQRYASEDAGGQACEGAGGSDTREALKESIARFRAFVQPQQAGGAHHGSGKRRQARSLGSVEANKEAKASDTSSTAQSPHVAPRHNGKQPSQHSSSSGSVSDSDGSGAARRHSAHPLNFGVGGQKDIVHLAATCSCGQAFTPDSVFCRLCGRRRPQEIVDGKVKSAFAPPARSAGAVLASSIDDDRGAQPAGGRCRQETSPSRGYTPESQEAIPDFRHGAAVAAAAGAGPEAVASRTPRIPATTPSLQEASPSLDSAVRNPLSQAELLYSGGAVLPVRNPLSQAELLHSAGGTLPLRTGGGGLTPKCCAASPCLGHSASFEDFSIAASCAPSMPQSVAPSAAPSPFCGFALSRPDVTPPTPSALAALGGNSLTVPDTVSVRILNGVSGEEEVRFPVPVQGVVSEQHFLSVLDRQCQQRAGQPLSGLNWLSQAQPGSRFQRRKCDASMVQELFGKGGHDHRKAPAVLLLCTVPVRPPSELQASKVRLKNLLPAQVALRTGATAEPVRVRLDTSPLEGGHDYTVAFTHQWTNMTYIAEAVLLQNLRGVELTVPWQMLAASSQTTEGLYDVHLVIDSAFRSENRRTLTVGSAESELSSSSVSQSCSGGSFVPIGKASK